MKFLQWWIALLVLCMASSAHAYVDPGTGMLVWQGLIAALGAVIVFFRNPREALKRLIARIKKRR